MGELSRVSPLPRTPARACFFAISLTEPARLSLQASSSLAPCSTPPSGYTADSKVVCGVAQGQEPSGISAVAALDAPILSCNVSPRARYNGRKEGGGGDAPSEARTRSLDRGEEMRYIIRVGARLFRGSVCPVCLEREM